MERTLYQLAGFVGVDPLPFSLRELFLMAEGKRAETWIYWSSSMSLTANINRDHKKQPTPFYPHDFNPYAPKREKRTDGGADFIAANKKAAKLRRFQ